MSSEIHQLPPFEKSIRQRIEGLDELRGIAVLLVLAAHCFNFRKSDWLQHFHLGSAAVDLFFVVSGYLIARILMTGRNEPRYYRKFYVRRVFRILPLYLLVVFAGLAIAAWRGKEIKSGLCYLCFAQNFLFDPSYGDGNLLPPDFAIIPGLGPLWSLAIEEQFYLLMPIAIATISTRWLTFAVVGTAALGVYLNLLATQSCLDCQWITYTNFRLPWLRMQFLSFGVLLNFQHRWKYLSVVFLFWLSMALLSQRSCHWMQFLAGCGIVSIVDLAITGKCRIRNQYLARIGVLCFGIYVLHLPILIIMRLILEKLHLPDVLFFLAFVGVSIGVAAISFRIFESPIQRFRTRFE